MAGNVFGEIFKIITFGESHGEMIGVVIDGCPAGLEIDPNYVQSELDRRKPGQSKITTQRKESDTVRFVSGIFDGKTLGTPIAALIPNEDQRSQDYEHIKDHYRPSHADFSYDEKYAHRDYRGGGRSSARETAARVVAGAIAKTLLKQHGIQITAYVSKVSTFEIPKDAVLDFSRIEETPIRCPDIESAEKMIKLIEAAKKDGDTLGGIVRCKIGGMPSGLGEPVFDKLHADLAKAMLSINAVKGFEYGSGFAGTELKGSEHNDEFVEVNGKIQTQTNHSGGIQGGISNGMDIDFAVAFKPVATLMKRQASVDKQRGAVYIEGRGRHDPCVLPRAVPIVESMAALVIADHLLRNRSAKI